MLDILSNSDKRDRYFALKQTPNLTDFHGNLFTKFYDLF